MRVVGVSRGQEVKLGKSLGGFFGFRKNWFVNNMERTIFSGNARLQRVRSEKILVPNVNSSFIKEEFFLKVLPSFCPNKSYPLLMLVLGIESWPRWLKP